MTSAYIAVDEIDYVSLVRQTRFRSGLTQEDFAHLVKVRMRTIGRWESGESIPSPLAIERLEAVLKEMGDRGRDLLEQYFE